MTRLLSVFKTYFCILILLSGYGCVINQSPHSEDIINLAGKWRFETDPADKGEKEEWYSRRLSKSIQLPGSMADNGYGKPQPTVPQKAWGKSHNEPTWHPVLRHDYRGSAWYQRDFTVPAGWSNKVLQLYLERVCWVSDVWIDDHHIGCQTSLSAPHKFIFGPLKPGVHTLTVRVDNRQLYYLGCNTHAYHEQSCTIYNGIIGKLQISARSAAFLENTQVFTDIQLPQNNAKVEKSNQRGGVKNESCRIDTEINNLSGSKISGKLTVKIFRKGTRQEIASKTIDCNIKPGITPFLVKIKVPADKIELWDEFSRPLYSANLVLESSAGKDNSSVTFGFRKFTTRGPQFIINGRPVFMRGEVNNAQFPLTGYPPMDKRKWLKIFRLFKSFGINHFRFHAWTPPEAAFQAADEVGIYLQPELPNGENAIKDKEGNKWRTKEFDRIIDTYGNHPSFVLMTMGNEAKIRDYTFLKELVKRGRRKDPRHLYATISNPEAGGFKDECPGDQFAVAHGSRKGRRRMESFINRQTPETMGDYSRTMVGRPVPQICHEMGQWYVFPDISEIDKYRGVLDPAPLKYFRKQLKANGLLDQAEEFVETSGQLSLLLYKEEIERSLRTPEYGGFQLLGLQDSFDQGAAYVGQINNFFKPKPYVTAEEFRHFCASEVLLARFSKRVWLNDETFKAKLEFANYGPETLINRRINWKLSSDGKIIEKGTFLKKEMPNSGLQTIGDISVPLSKLEAAAKLKLSVNIEGSDISNSWDIWVYPAKLKMPAPKDVTVTTKLTPEIIKKLQSGAKVVLFPRDFRSSYATAMTPPFWSPIMFGNQRQTVGFLCDPEHPAFADFPTDSYNNWQWFELTKNGACMHLKGLEGKMKPIVQAIDRPDRDYLLGIIYEGKVGKGKLLVCTLDVNRDLKNRPVARQLRYSLIKYAASDKFNPTVELDLKKHIPVGRKPSYLATLPTKVSADSENENNWAIYAVDDNLETIWQTRSDDTRTPPPHYLKIELPKPITIKGIVQIPGEDSRKGRITKYRIDVSDDGKNWTTAASGKWDKSSTPKRVIFSKPVTCRFIKLEALSVKGNIWASVAEFDIIK